VISRGEVDGPIDKFDQIFRRLFLSCRTYLLLFLGNRLMQVELVKHQSKNYFHTMSCCLVTHQLIFIRVKLNVKGKGSV